MLTYLLTTQDEGPGFDLFLRALAKAMGRGDTLLAFHNGDAHTLKRLQAFAEHNPARIIQADSHLDRLSDLLRLGLEMVETEYVLALSPTDRLQCDAITALRGNLQRETPDLCLMHSAWWLADADHLIPRSDSDLFEPLPVWPDTTACTGLLPDPRRFILRTTDWVHRTATWPTILDSKTLYMRMLEESTALMVCHTPVLLHLLAHSSPEPILSQSIDALMACKKNERAACLAEWAPLLDEHLDLCPPAQAETILRALPRIAALLPRSAQQNMTIQSGAFARLLSAQIRHGDLGLKTEFSLLLATQQQHRSEALAAAYGKLRQDLDLALPGQDYLQTLYTRLRSL